MIIASSNETKIQDAVSRLKASYPSAISRISSQQLDIGNPETVEEDLKRVLDKCGQLDHIVWTAGEPLAIKPLADVDSKYIQDIARSRFTGRILLGKLAPKYLKPDPASSITFTTGTASERPLPNWTVMSSYATGLHGMTRGLALDLKPIRVNIVSPGAVDTPLWTQPQEEKEQYFKMIAKGTATGKVGLVEDVAESYIYLMKDKNITGSMISTNGGILLLGPH